MNLRITNPDHIIRLSVRQSADVLAAAVIINDWVAGLVTVDITEVNGLHLFCVVHFCRREEGDRVLIGLFNRSRQFDSRGIDDPHIIVVPIDQTTDAATTAITVNNHFAVVETVGVPEVDGIVYIVDARAGREFTTSQDRFLIADNGLRIPVDQVDPRGNSKAQAPALKNGPGEIHIQSIIQRGDIDIAIRGHKGAVVDLG